MEKTIDRRTARSRRALHEALIALILRKGYDAITVQDLIDEADIGRSTFYAHYTGKEDLLRAGFEALRADLADAQRRAEAARASRADTVTSWPLAFSLALFEHACGHRHVYRALISGRGGAIATSEMRRVLSDVVRNELTASWDDRMVPRDLAVEFVVTTFLTVLTWLLKRPSKPVQADATFRHLVVSGIGGSLRDKPCNARR
jgi:AcrR family transcriptional regulator